MAFQQSQPSTQKDTLPLVSGNYQDYALDYWDQRAAQAKKLTVEPPIPTPPLESHPHTHPPILSEISEILSTYTRTPKHSSTPSTDNEPTTSLRYRLEKFKLLSPRKTPRTACKSHVDHPSLTERTFQDSSPSTTQHTPHHPSSRRRKAKRQLHQSVASDLQSVTRPSPPITHPNIREQRECHPQRRHERHPSAHSHSSIPLDPQDQKILPFHEPRQRRSGWPERITSESQPTFFTGSDEEESSDAPVGTRRVFDHDVYDVRDPRYMHDVPHRRRTHDPKTTDKSYIPTTRDRKPVAKVNVPRALNFPSGLSGSDETVANLPPTIQHQDHPLAAPIPKQQQVTGGDHRTQHRPLFSQPLWHLQQPEPVSSLSAHSRRRSREPKTPTTVPRVSQQGIPQIPPLSSSRPQDLDDDHSTSEFKAPRRSSSTNDVLTKRAFLNRRKMSVAAALPKPMLPLTSDSNAGSPGIPSPMTRSLGRSMSPLPPSLSGLPASPSPSTMPSSPVSVRAFSPDNSFAVSPAASFLSSFMEGTSPSTSSSCLFPTGNLVDEGDRILEYTVGKLVGKGTSANVYEAFLVENDDGPTSPPPPPPSSSQPTGNNSLQSWFVSSKSGSRLSSEFQPPSSSSLSSSIPCHRSKRQRPTKYVCKVIVNEDQLPAVRERYERVHANMGGSMSFPSSPLPCEESDSSSSQMDGLTTATSTTSCDDPPKPDWIDRRAELEHEIALWKHFRHPNICKLYDVVSTPDAVFIFMEACDQGSLMDLVKMYAKRQQPHRTTSGRWTSAATISNKRSPSSGSIYGLGGNAQQPGWTRSYSPSGHQRLSVNSDGSPSTNSLAATWKRVSTGTPTHSVNQPESSGASSFFASGQYANSAAAAYGATGAGVRRTSQGSTSTVRGLPEALAASLFSQLCDAVDYLHNTVGVVHRDIKLENVVIGSGGVPKLIDFGLSERIEEEVTKYRTVIHEHLNHHVPYKPENAKAKGTMAYCSPEDLAKSCALIEPTHPGNILSFIHTVNLATVELDSALVSFVMASDVWALGVVLYALVTGGLPFKDDFAPRLIKSVIDGDWTRVETIDVEEEAQGLLSSAPSSFVDMTLASRFGNGVMKERDMHRIPAHPLSITSTSHDTVNQSGPDEDSERVRSLRLVLDSRTSTPTDGKVTPQCAYLLECMLDTAWMARADMRKVVRHVWTRVGMQYAEERSIRYQERVNQKMMQNRS